MNCQILTKAFPYGAFLKGDVFVNERTLELVHAVTDQSADGTMAIEFAPGITSSRRKFMYPREGDFFVICGRVHTVGAPLPHFPKVERICW